MTPDLVQLFELGMRRPSFAAVRRAVQWQVRTMELRTRKDNQMSLAPSNAVGTYAGDGDPTIQSTIRAAFAHVRLTRRYFWPLLGIQVTGPFLVADDRLGPLEASRMSWPRWPSRQLCPLLATNASRRRRDVLPVISAWTPWQLLAVVRGNLAGAPDYRALDTPERTHLSSLRLLAER